METSHFSTASSTTDYSGIGFEKTLSLHFDELKRDQQFVASKVQKLIQSYRSIVMRKAKWEEKKKSLEEEAAKQGLMLSDIVVYSDEDSNEEMALEMAQLSYSDQRQEAFRLVKAWAQDSANLIATYPGFDVEKKKKGAIDFINLMKKYIKSTKTFGEDEEEEEEEEEKKWLEEKMKKLPPAQLDVGPVKDRLRSSRAKERSRVDSPSGIAPEFRTSTPEVTRDGKGGQKSDDKAPKSNLGTMIDTKNDGKTEEEDKGGDNADLPHDETQQEDDDSGNCPVERTTGNKDHVCVEMRKTGGEDEEEPDGPDYIVVKNEKHKRKEIERIAEDESLHRSIIEKKLKRPISEGLRDTSLYKRYEKELDDMARQKTEADRAMISAQEKEDQAKRMEKEEEEEKKRKREEEEYVLRDALASIERHRKIDEDRLKLAYVRHQEVDGIIAKKKEEKKRRDEWNKKQEEGKGNKGSKGKKIAKKEDNKDEAESKREEEKRKEEEERRKEEEYEEVFEGEDLVQLTVSSLASLGMLEDVPEHADEDNSELGDEQTTVR